MLNEGSRDLKCAAATAPLAGMGATVLALGAHWAWPLISYARPELALVFLLTLIGALTLAWNALWALIALLAQTHTLPTQARLVALKVARICGTGRAQRIIARSLASSAIGASIFTVGTGAAFALPNTDPTSADPASFTWIWEASDSKDSVSPHTKAPSDSLSTSPSQGVDSTSATERQSPSATRTPTPPTASSTDHLHAHKEQPSHTNTDESSTLATCTVLPGDTLWDIARTQLLPDTDVEKIDAMWRKIYSLNADTIGSDPNLIRPGQTLLLPQESQ